MEEPAISFAILTPTHERPDLLARSFESVQAQTWLQWELVVINDSPAHDYTSIEPVLKAASKVSYLKNDHNIGKNASLNRALEYLKEKKFTGYIVFLDDDDWLHPDCLATFASAITKEPSRTWFVSNRTDPNSTSFTHNKTGTSVIHYFRDYLIRKKFQGDATHCIKSEAALSCLFSDRIKNAEEWIYFSQIAIRSPFFHYLDSTGTYSEGYAEKGLTRKFLSQKSRTKNFKDVFAELDERGLWNHYTRFYMLLRFAKNLLG